MTFVAVGERTTLFRAHPSFFINRSLSIIKKAIRAKKEFGKGVSRSNPIGKKRKTGN